jgi:hypothetical protein
MALISYNLGMPVSIEKCLGVTGVVKKTLIRDLRLLLKVSYFESKFSCSHLNQKTNEIIF